MSRSSAAPTSAPSTSPIAPLWEMVRELRARAQERRTEGAESVALTYEKVANEMSNALDAWENSDLTMEQAVEYSGYTATGIRLLVRQGRATLRRRDLPRKPHAAPALALERGETPRARPSLADDIVTRRRRRRTG